VAWVVLKLFCRYLVAFGTSHSKIMLAGVVVPRFFGNLS
jgi:hypothetical protein